MRRPRSTYRLQVNADFTLSRVRELIDYFAELGISDLYLSPLLQARPGSTHGYDVTDPARVNPEIGSAAELELLSADLRERDMGILLDIVPNHMAASEENPWWRDVLEHGPASQYAHYFDVDWTAGLPDQGRIVLPILGEELTACIDKGDVKLVLEDHQPAIAYMDRRLPIDPASYPVLIRYLLESNDDIAPALRAELDRVAEDASRLPHRLHSTPESGRLAQALMVKQNLTSALERVQSERQLTLPLSPERMHELLRQQSYALTYWVRGSGKLNYRRFFDIADLAGVRIEDPSVFEAIHARSLPWLLNGTITGVRIDHIDGLLDPTRYLQQLRDGVRERSGSIPYVVVEKILVGSEELPRRWATAGTTGYEFASLVNGLFVDPAGFPKLAKHFGELAGIRSFPGLVYNCKLEVMRLLFPAELESLTVLLCEIAELSAEDAERGLRELTACLPVYRTYFSASDAGAANEQAVTRAIECAERRGCPPELLQPLRRIILTPENEKERQFTLRWQQFTGPVMAKGLEDTALYRYTALVSVCDVGIDPLNAHTAVEEFHSCMQLRSACWPATLNATSTHDSKRGEDVRARINVLSELTDDWLGTVNRWLELNARYRKRIDGEPAPHPAEELLIYQTLLGAWPLGDVDDVFLERVQEFLRKALREAKERTSWREPNEAYEQVACDFVRSILSDPTMQSELRSFERRTSFYGALNSLSQLVLKLGAPGVPDFYQGTECWSLTLVDPDNRRPVDYDGHMLLRGDAQLSVHDLSNWRDGRIKLHVTRTGLALRNEWAEVFGAGEYVPLEIRGERARNVIAFERRQGGRRAVFVAARFYSELCEPEQWPPADTWNNTSVVLGNASWREQLTNRELSTSGQAPVNVLFERLPFAILTAE